MSGVWVRLWERNYDGDFEVANGWTQMDEMTRVKRDSYYGAFDVHW